MAELKPVEVFWMDAAVKHGWSTDEEPPVADSSSVGYLIANTDEEVVLCFGLGQTQKLCLTTLPKACVQKIVELKEGRCIYGEREHRPNPV